MGFGFAELLVGGEGGSVGGVGFGRRGVEVEGGFELEFSGVELGIAGEERGQVEVNGGEFGT